MAAARPRKQVDTSTYRGRFALRLKELREEAGLSVEQFAEKSGIPVQTLYNWEKARRVPSMDQFPQISKALGVSIDTLLPKI